MANFRTNHTQGAAGGGMLPKVGIFAVVIGALLWGFNQFSGGNLSFDEDPVEQTEDNRPKSNPSDGPKGPSEPPVPLVADNILPTSTTGQIIKHHHYALSYSEEHEQAEWVAYELTRESLYIKNVSRTDNFRPDPKVRKQSASRRDYKGSGYDRGHLAPAGDMAFSKLAMSETFYMSNMSPQIRNFNGGIWRELEETVRDWTKKFRHLYIVTGPVLTREIRETIGNNQVSVPEYYYKVILDIHDPEMKAIGFVLPNEISFEPLSDFAVSVDQVEALTGIDFFPQLMEKDLEEELESQVDVRLWNFNKKRYDNRVDNWNTRR